MLKSVVYILILTQLVGHVEEMKLLCPQNNQLEMRANDFCENASKYHCLHKQDGDLIEICKDPVIVPAGKYPVYSSFVETFIFEDCHEDYYQPVALLSNKFYTQRCSRMKSLCNNEGEIICDHGNTTTNRRCLCNYTAGYIAHAFILVNRLNETCFDKNSGIGGCVFHSCPKIQELNPAYKCVNKCPKEYHRPFRQFECSKISVEMKTSTVFTTDLSTAVFPTKEKVDDNNDNELLKTITIACTVILILIICIAAVVFYLCRNKKGNEPDSNIPASQSMTELKSSSNDNGSRPTAEGVMYIKMMNINAETVHIGNQVTVDKISKSSKNVDEIITENEHTKVSKRQVPTECNNQLPTGSKGQVPMDNEGQLSSDSRSQVPTGSKGHVPTDSKRQMPTDSKRHVPTVNNGQMPTDSNGQMPTDSNGQMSTDSNGQVPKDGNGQMPTDSNRQVPKDGNGQMLTDSNGQVPTDGNGHMPIAEGCKRQTDLSDENSFDDSDEEEMPLLSLNVAEYKEKPILSSKIVSRAEVKKVTDKIDSLSRKKHGLYLEDVPEDGDCLYHAFIMLLQKHYPENFDEMDVKALRCKLAKFLESNPNTPNGLKFKEFLPLSLDPDLALSHPEDIARKENVENVSDQMELGWQRFLKGIQDGDWGGSLEIQGLSQLFNVPINVLYLNDNQDDLLQHKFTSGIDNYENPPIWLGHISIEGKGYHFVALLPVAK